MIETKINVIINNKKEELAKNTTAADLLKMRSLKKAAVWVNGRQLLKAEYETHLIEDGDEIRLLRIMAGG